MGISAGISRGGRNRIAFGLCALEDALASGVRVGACLSGEARLHLLPEGYADLRGRNHAAIQEEIA